MNNMPTPIKVTDLEKFALEQIWRPYQDTLSRRNKLRIATNELPRDLHCTLQTLIEDEEWAYKVLKRISEIDFYFPDYIKHPLVDYIKKAVEQIKNNPLPPCLSNGNATPQQQKYAAEALEPFANIANGYDDELDGDDRPVGPVQLKFCRKARSALTAPGATTKSDGGHGLEALGVDHVEGEDAVERVARIIDPDAFSTNYMSRDEDWHPDDDKLKQMRARDKARAILATGLVPDEAAITDIADIKKDMLHQYHKAVCSS